MSTIRETHKGVEITYIEKDNSWQFTYDGATRTAPSLEAAKARINKKPTFKRIPVLFSKWGGDELTKGEVTSFVMDGFRNEAWVVSGKDRCKTSLGNIYPITGKNEKIAQEIIAKTAQIDALQEEIAKLKEGLVRIKAPKEMQ